MTLTPITDYSNYLCINILTKFILFLQQEMITWANPRLFTIGSLFFDLFLGARTLWDYLTFKWKIDTQKKIWFDFYVSFFILQQEMVTRANQRLSTIGSLPPSALRSSKFDELMVDRSPKKSDKEVLTELERQLPNLPLGTIMDFHDNFF